MSCLYDLVRLPIYRRCDGYYIRWYYNGWHYWYFYPGKIGFNTEGEKYRTLGSQTLTIGTGQITEGQANAIRTIMNTREIYIYTDAGWGAVRAIHSPVVVYDHVTHGYEMEFTIIIGSRAISITGFSPVTTLPSREPDPQCELDIAIAGQVWMCKNWDAAYPGSKVYDNDEDNRAALGGLYTYDQVMTPGFCPAGWHVPTVAEWNTLITACGGAAVAGGVLKEIGFTRWNAPNTGAVDTHDFTAVGGGYSSPSAFGGVYDQGMFWTADPYEMHPIPPNTFAEYAMMQHDTETVLISYIPRNYYMCLRLIKNYYCPACVALPATNLGNNSFTANWNSATGSTGYYLDVSTSPTFATFIPGYHNLFVGNVLTYNVTGLTPGVTYYYRMRSQTAVCISIYSNVISQVVGIGYGLLYNHFAAVDARNICAAGWHIPTETELDTLGAFLGNAIAGGELKETGLTHWTTPNTGATNSTLFNGRGAGYRVFDTGAFVTLNTEGYFWSETEFNALLGRFRFLINTNTILNGNSQGTDKNLGASLRPIKDATILTDGQTGTYTGNDGKVYRTICIGTQEYVADNIAETLYRNGDPVPEVTNDAAWAALATGALCAYNNDWNNV